MPAAALVLLNERKRLPRVGTTAQPTPARGFLVYTRKLLRSRLGWLRGVLPFLDTLFFPLSVNRLDDLPHQFHESSRVLLPRSLFTELPDWLVVPALHSAPPACFLAEDLPAFNQGLAGNCTGVNPDCSVRQETSSDNLRMGPPPSGA